jgi:c-di-GMP-binding flagellar brake protein YcgR
MILTWKGDGAMSRIRRKHERVTAPKGTFVIVSPGTDNERKVQLIDISQGGAAFLYQGSKEELAASGLLKLLAKEAEVETVNFETVFDAPAACSADESVPSRRRGVKFRWMGILKEDNLKDFVKNIVHQGLGIFGRKC